MKLVIAAVAVAAALIAPSAFAGGTTLNGTVGPGFTITLQQGGKTVKSLKAGTYTLKISDLSNIHDFHLTGPGVNKATSVQAVSTTKWTVKLKKGTYHFVCDPHKAIMHGVLKVT